MNVVFSCRDLLEEGKATIPCLAERLTSELIMHICVSARRAEQSLASAELNHVDTHGPPGHLVKMWAQIQGLWMWPGMLPGGVAIACQRITCRVGC